MPDHVTPGDRSLPIALRRLAAGAVVLLLAMFSGAVPVAASSPALGGEPLPAAADGGVIGGFDVDELVEALADNHVAVVGSADIEADLVDITRDARDKGIDLSVVTLDRSPTAKDTEELALTLARQVGGVVLVLTPATLSVQGTDVSEGQRVKAKDAANAAGGDDVAAARAAADSLTAKSFPWTLVIIGVIILVIVVAIAGRFWEKRRKQKADAGALAELTGNLKERVGKLAPMIIGISPRIEIAQRPHLEDKFNLASSDYNGLLTKLSTPLASRKEVDHTTAAVVDLEKRLADIDAQLDAAAPGLQPPSPAG